MDSFDMENHVLQLGIFLTLFLWQRPLLHLSVLYSRTPSSRMLDILDLLSCFHILSSPIVHLSFRFTFQEVSSISILL